MFTTGSAKVTATTNSHYGFAEGTPEAARFQSLSYQFDLPDRSIVFTGDTGPSVNVEHLARGADVLVAEIIDPDQALADLQAIRPDTGPTRCRRCCRSPIRHTSCSARIGPRDAEKAYLRA